MEKDNITQFPGAKSEENSSDVSNVLASNVKPAVKKELVNSEQQKIVIDNPKIIEMMNAYKQDKTVENLNLLLNELVKATVILPATIRESDNKPAPALMKSADGGLYLGMFTDKEQIPEDKRTEMAIVSPFLIANKTAINPQDNMAGLVINPYTDNFILKRELLERIDEIEMQKIEARKKQAELEAQRAKGIQALEALGQIVTDENGNRALKMNETQYNQFERTQYEVGYIPNQLFTKGQEFMDRLLADRETCIDEMYEDSYREKRMYPYLPEDFVVMPMSINDDLTVVTVDMPNRNVAFGNAYRLYISWDKAASKGRYFRIVQGKNRGERLLEEICDNKTIKHLGKAPEEGTEIGTITDLILYGEVQKTQEASDDEE